MGYHDHGRARVAHGPAVWLAVVLAEGEER